MKVWPIDPLVPRNLRLEVPEKLPQGSSVVPEGVDYFGNASGSGNAYRQSRGDLIISTLTLGKMQALVA